MIEGHNTLSLKSWPNRRRFEERRSFSLATIIRGCLNGRRRSARRSNDLNGYYTDWYEPWLLYTAIGILLLCSTDAVLTLKLLQLGAVELNGFMAILINTDVQLFIIIKMLLTGISLIFLVIHANFRFLRLLRISYLLQTILCGYLVLIVYELALLSS